MRCYEYARALLDIGFVVDFFGLIEVSWLRQHLDTSNIRVLEEVDDDYSLLVLDSYEQNYLLKVRNETRARVVVQIADRNTPLLSDAYFIWLDTNLPEMELGIQERVLLKGLAAFPTKKLCTTKVLADSAEDVLIVFGGSPKKEDIDSILEVVSKQRYDKIAFHVFAKFFDDNQVKKNFTFYPLGSRLSEVASLCETVISGAGSSMWDFLAGKRHLGAVCLVANQEGNYKYATEREMAVGLGNLGAGDSLDTDSIDRLLFDTNFRSQLVANIPKDLDGKGAIRFTEQMLGLLNQPSENN